MKTIIPLTIENLEIILSEMKKIKDDHPKAKLYYDHDDNEIKIVYPLPSNLGNFINQFEQE